jgi:hypothetical protein
MRAALFCSLLVVACSGDVSSSSNELSGGGAAGGSDAATPCESDKQALTELIEQNRTCENDDDCQYLVSFCLQEGSIDCTGARYVNMNVDTEAFELADNAYTQCMQAEPNSDCGTCTGCSKLPLCDSGICAASDEYEQP